MKAKEILILCEDNTVTLSDSYELVLNYFEKKFQGVNAKLSVSTAGKKVAELRYFVSDDFCDDLRKNLRHYGGRIAKFLGQHHLAVQNWGYGRVIFFAIIDCLEGVPLFRIDIRDGANKRNEILIQVILEKSFFYSFSDDPVELTKIYARIDLIVKALRLTTVE